MGSDPQVEAPKKSAIKPIILTSSKKKEKLVGKEDTDMAWRYIDFNSSSIQKSNKNVVTNSYDGTMRNDSIFKNIQGEDNIIPNHKTTG